MSPSRQETIHFRPIFLSIKWLLEVFAETNGTHPQRQPSSLTHFRVRKFLCPGHPFRALPPPRTVGRVEAGHARVSPERLEPMGQCPLFCRSRATSHSPAYKPRLGGNLACTTTSGVPTLHRGRLEVGVQLAHPGFPEVSLKHLG